jgi:hypothetical protein
MEHKMLIWVVPRICKLQECCVHLPKRICENCGCEYWPIYPTQRWCNYICRNEYRNAEHRAARELWKQSGKPTLEMIEGEAQR